MLNITTTYTTTAKGAGRIVAKGAGKQHTEPYDPARGVAANHGAAAGVLARKILPMNEWQSAADRATHTDLGDGKRRFTL